MPQHYDSLETRTPAARAHALAQRLPQVIGHAQAQAPYYREALRGVDPAQITSAEALAALPLLRKSDLIALQARTPPLGGLLTCPLGAAGHVFQSPGPIHEVHGTQPDAARFARAMFAAGFRAGELVYNTYSYHFTPAGFMAESGALALGCAVFAAGGGQTELQAQAIARLRPTCYSGTPSFLNILLDKAAELGLDARSLTRALVSAEPLPPSLRARFAERGVTVYQTYATGELGIIGYETEALEGLVVDEGVVVEIVHPGTGEPVATGEIGEVVVTVLNAAYPLIRFATGDLSAVLPGADPTGRTNLRIKGWLGRADQTTKVRGMFVHPEQVRAVVKRHPQIRRARLVVTQSDHRDQMTLTCEIAGAIPGDLSAAVGASVQELCKLRADVAFVPVGSLPQDGKVIADQRDFK